MNINKRELNVIVNNENKGKYTEISIDKPIFPAIFLYNTNDTVEINII